MSVSKRSAARAKRSKITRSALHAAFFAAAKVQYMEDISKHITLKYKSSLPVTNLSTATWTTSSRSITDAAQHVWAGRNFHGCIYELGHSRATNRKTRRPDVVVLESTR